MHFSHRTTQYELAIFYRSLVRPMLIVLFGLFCLSQALVLRAAEQDSQFYQKLREAGQERLAGEMLERAASDPIVSQMFRDAAVFEKLSLDIAVARKEKNSKARKASLQALAKRVDEFAGQSLSEGQGIPFAKAMGDLATAFADEARREAVMAQGSVSKTQKLAMIKASRASLEKAEGRLVIAAARFEQEHEKLRGVNPQSEEGKSRVDLLGRLAQMRLMSARLLHEQAKTYDSGSSKFKELNQQAAKQLGELYEKHSTWMVGLYAHLYEGKCYRALNETAMAAGCFEALAEQPAGVDELRSLITHAQAELAALWLQAGKPEQSLKGPRKWFIGLRAAQRDTVEAAMLSYYLGAAQLAVADTLKSGTREQQNAYRKASEWLSASARKPSEVQMLARVARNQLSNKLGVDQAKPETFEQAYEAGKQAIETIASNQAALAMASGMTKGAREELENQSLVSRSNALRSFKAALPLADAKTEQTQINEVRYLLAWLTYESGDLVRATKMAEYLVRKSPKDPSAEKSALLGLAALERLSLDGNENAGKRLKQLAAASVKLWPKSSIAETAVTVLLNESLRAGSFDEAEELLASLSPEQRAPHTLRYASTRWEQVLGQRDGASAADLESALASLRQAYDAMQKQGKFNVQSTTAALYLAREDLAAGRTDEAVRLLIDDRNGPFAKLIAQEPPANNPRFAQLAAQTSVRAFVLSGDSKLAKSLELFDQFVEVSDRKTSVRSRLSLAVELMKQVDGPKANDTSDAVKQRAVLAIEQTIGKVYHQADPTDWNTRTWVAQTYLKLSNLSQSEEQQATSLQAANEAFNGLLKQVEKDKSFAPTPSAVLAIRLQTAKCELRLGRYDEALAGFEALLAEKPTLLEVQIAAAKALQDSGKSAGNLKRIEESIAGSRPGSDGKNVVWGWRKIAAVTARVIATNKKYEEMFFEAWFNVAQGRYLVGQLASGDEKAEHYRKSLSTIRAMRRQHPDLGGKTMQAQFDALEEKVSKAAP